MCGFMCPQREAFNDNHRCMSSCLIDERRRLSLSRKHCLDIHSHTHRDERVNCTYGPSISCMPYHWGLEGSTSIRSTNPTDSHISIVSKGIE